MAAVFCCPFWWWCRNYPNSLLGVADWQKSTSDRGMQKRGVEWWYLAVTIGLNLVNWWRYRGTTQRSKLTEEQNEKLDPSELTESSVVGRYHRQGQKLSTVEEWWRTRGRLGTQRGCWRGEREMLIPFWGHSQQGPSETWTTMPKSDSARKVRDNSLPDDAMKEDVFFYYKSLLNFQFW